MISYLNPSRVIHYGPYTHNKCNTTCIMIEHSLWLLCNLHVSISYIPPHYWHRYFTPLGCRCFKNLQWQITQSKKHAYWGLLGYADAPVGELFLPFWRIIFKAKQSKRNDIHPMKQHQIPDKSSLQQHCCQNTKLSAENIKFDKKKKYTKFLSSYELHHCIIQTKTWLCCPFMLCGGQRGKKFMLQRLVKKNPWNLDYSLTECDTTC